MAKVQGLGHVGLYVRDVERELAFFRDVIGLPLVEAGPDFAWSTLPDSSQFELFGPADRDHDHFTTGPVPEFLVEDLDAAAAELEASGVELLAPIRGTEEQRWLHFRAPDGNVYGLTARATRERSP